MQVIYRDEKHPDLVWLKFEGPSWDEFHELMNQFETWTRETQAPFYLVFYPTIDMPKGSPLPHIRRLIKFLNAEPKIRYMITILPKNMIIAKGFANLATRLFPGQTMQSTIITDVDEVYAIYRKIVDDVPL